MNIKTAESLALDKMSQHGLIQKGWKLAWNKAKTVHGSCQYYTATIVLSTPLTELNTEEVVTNTILHEIAHALVGAGCGHNYIWRMKAREIGCSANRTSGQEAVQAAGKYIGKCKKGLHTFNGYKKRRGLSSCSKCSTSRQFSFENIITWEIAQ